MSQPRTARHFREHRSLRQLTWHSATLCHQDHIELGQYPRQNTAGGKALLTGESSLTGEIVRQRRAGEMQLVNRSPMPAHSSRRRVVVVGGGIVGCATAYLLARAGATVTLIERDGIGAHASGCNAGNLNPLYRTPPTLVRFALEALALHREIFAELSLFGCAQYSLRPVRRVHLGRDEPIGRSSKRPLPCSPTPPTSPRPGSTTMISAGSSPGSTAVSTSG